MISIRIAIRHRRIAKTNGNINAQQKTRNNTATERHITENQNQAS